VVNYHAIKAARSARLLQVRFHCPNDPHLEVDRNEDATFDGEMSSNGSLGYRWLVIDFSPTDAQFFGFKARWCLIKAAE
jgi:hypothetical protein